MSETKPERNADARTYAGGCHSGAVRYEVELDLGEGVSRCNCSICTKISTSSIMVKPSAFKLVSGEDSLIDYRRGENPTHFRFCKVCGIHAFAHGHLEEVGGDYVSINVNSLDDVDLTGVKFIYWDGRHNNWDAGPRGEPWPVRP